MIQKYVYGAPIRTDAVVEHFPDAVGAPKHGTVSLDGGFQFDFQMDQDDIVYGLGEAVRGINKRGFRYVSDCTDVMSHTETQACLYGAHNFILVSGRETFGLFFDYPAKMIFDIGFTDIDQLTVSCKGTDLVLYVIEGDSPRDIVRQFRRAIGRSYIPPKFAFGYSMSRWGYQTKEDFRAVAEGHRKNHIPLDMICMDIDYMEKYKDFSVDPKTFSDFPEFVSGNEGAEHSLDPHYRCGREDRAGIFRL